jgi:quercetin dioxygenase-like cupin family protein
MVAGLSGDEGGVTVGTVRVVEDAEIEWHGGDPEMIERVRARGVEFTPEELAGRTREHHVGSDTAPELFEVRFQPDTVVNSHAHLRDEIIFVLEGELIVGSRVLTSGSSVYIAANTLYSFRAGPDGVHFVNFRPTAGAGYVSKDEFMAKRPPRDGASAGTSATAGWMPA